MDSELVGVVGGLGPKASAIFYDSYLIEGRIKLFKAMTDPKIKNTKERYNSVIQQTKSAWTSDEVEEVYARQNNRLTDQDHIPVMIMSASNIPCRVRYILGNSNVSPVPALLEAIKRLNSAGVTKICLACNTAHYYIPEISQELLREGVEVEFLNMIQLTLQHAQRTLGQANRSGIKLGLLASPASHKIKLYETLKDRLGENFNDISFISPSEEGILELERAIIGVKAGETDIESFPACKNLFRLLKEAKNLQEKGCVGVILGCTELPLLLNKEFLKKVASNKKSKFMKELMSEFCITELNIKTWCDKDEFFINPGVVLADEITRLTLVSETEPENEKTLKS